MKNIILMLAALFFFDAASLRAQDVFGRGRNPDTTYLNADDFNVGELIKVDTLSGVKYFTGVDAGVALSQPLKYIAQISQVGSGAPIVNNVLLNTLGATATYTRLSAGEYSITFSSGVLTLGKTTVETNLIVSSTFFNALNGYIYPEAYVGFLTTGFVFYSAPLSDPLTPADDILENAILEITVFP